MKYAEGFPHVSRTICKDCKIVFANPVADQEELLAFYANYYDKGNFGALSYKENVSEKIKRILSEDKAVLQQKKKDILSYMASGNFLDIGCGLGEELTVFHQLGYKVYGTEYDADCIQFIQERLPDAALFNGDLLDAKYADETFDVVNIYHVIEHLTDPIAYIKEIKRILKKDGIMVIGTPNIGSFAYRIFRKINFLFFSIPMIVDGLEHTVIFNKRNLRTLVEQNGFIVLIQQDEKLGSGFSEIFSSNLSFKKKVLRYVQTFFSLNQVLIARKCKCP